MAVISGAGQQMNTLSSAVALTSIPSRAVKAKISVTGPQPIRWREDGTNPTATEGHLAVQYTSFYVTGRPQLDGFRVIETDTSSAIFVTYYDSENNY